MRSSGNSDRELSPVRYEIEPVIALALVECRRYHATGGYEKVDAETV
jgi:hypothetical protein